MKRLDICALVFGLIGLTIMIIFIALLIPEHLNLGFKLSLEKAASIGDFIGGVIGVLFSIAAFLLLYETLNVQKAEINQTNKQLQKQSFENNLFQMINVHNEFVSEFDIRKGRISSQSKDITNNEIITEGRDSFKFLYNNIFNKNIIASKITDKIYIQSLFDNLLQEWADDLNHYFKHSLEIIKYIKKSTPVYITEKESKNYAALFNSGLSKSEEVFLFYYIVFKSNVEEKRFITELNFFNKLSPSSLLHIDHLNWIYE